MLTLRLLACGEPVTELPLRIVTEATEATSAVITAVKAAGTDARAVAAFGSGGRGAETLLQARLSRLASAAGDLVAATVAGDLAEVRRQLDRFDALTAAIWTVLRALYGPGAAQQFPVPRPADDALTAR
jgi:hypothetical protein